MRSIVIDKVCSSHTTIKWGPSPWPINKAILNYNFLIWRNSVVKEADLLSLTALIKGNPLYDVCFSFLTPVISIYIIVRM